jgi:hypothetical protein
MELITVFTYDSHYFQWQNNICRLRYHDLQTRNVLICIFYVAFVLEMLKLHQGNTSIQNRDNPVDVIETVHHTRKWVHSFHQHLVAADNVQNEEEVLNVVHATPSTTTRGSHVKWVSDVAWHMLHEEQLFPFHIQLIKGLQPREGLHLQCCQWLPCTI